MWPSLELLSTFILLWNWGSGMWIYSTKVIQNYERNSGLPQKWTSLESLSVRMLVLSETQRKKRRNTLFGFKYFPYLRLSDILGHSLLTCRSKATIIKIGSLVFLFIYYFPFSLSSTEWREHNRHFIEDHGLKINNMKGKNHRSHPDKPSFLWILSCQISRHSQTLEKEGVACKTWWNFHQRGLK